METRRQSDRRTARQIAEGERRYARDLLGYDYHDRIRCGDCGEPGERTGHMGCQYPGLRSERRSC
jgi:hypothetical protein